MAAFAARKLEPRIDYLGTAAAVEPQDIKTKPLLWYSTAASTNLVKTCVTVFSASGDVCRKESSSELQIGGKNTEKEQR